LSHFEQISFVGILRGSQAVTQLEFVKNIVDVIFHRLSTEGKNVGGWSLTSRQPWKLTSAG